jgi:DNA-binding NarL/FixJ family response regulator
MAGASFPIVIITAHDSPNLREECMRAGAIEYLCKPLDIRALVKAVSQVMPSAG